MLTEKSNLFVPTSLVRRYTYKVKAKPQKYAEIEKAIVGARLPLTVQELLAAGTLYSYIAFVVGTFLGVLILYKVSPAFIFYILQKTPYYYVALAHYSLISKLYLLLGIIFGVVAYRLTKYIVLSYPFFVANLRKGEIEMYLPHAINMMYGMAIGGSPAYDIVRTVAESKSVFGELSKEFMIIIEMVDVFKKDLHEAIKFVRDTTPSPKLATFLDNFVFILRGGGKVSDFLKRVSEEYLEQQEISFGTFVEFMGLMAEVYLSLFVLLPLFILIILIVARLIGQNLLIEYRNGLVIALPIVSAFFIWLISSSIPIPKIKVEEFEERFDVIKANVVDIVRTTFTINRAKRIKNRIKAFLLHPFKTKIYEMKFRIVAFHLAVLTFVVFIVTQILLPPDLSLIVTASSFIIPMIFLAEYRERVLRKAERHLPSVFSELAILNEAGLNVIEGLDVLAASMTEMGVLSRELSIARRELKLGILVPRAVVRMGKRLKSGIFAKIAPIVIKALETAPTVKDAFYMVAKYAETEVLFRDRVRSSMLLYVVVIYMSIAVFLFVSYIVLQNFLGVFAKIGPTSGMGGMSIGFSNVSFVKEIFFQVTMVVSIISGLIAGVIGEGKITAGLKHSYILAIMTYVVFVYFIH